MLQCLFTVILPHRHHQRAVQDHRPSPRNAQFQLTVASRDFVQSYPCNGGKLYDEDDLNIEDGGDGSVRQSVSNKTLGPSGAGTWEAWAQSKTTSELFNSGTMTSTHSWKGRLWARMGISRTEYSVGNCPAKCSRTLPLP